MALTVEGQSADGTLLGYLYGFDTCLDDTGFRAKPLKSKAD